MGDPSPPPTPSAAAAPPPLSVTLVPPSAKKRRHHRPVKIFRVFRNVLRSFPIIAPARKLASSLPGGIIPDSRSASAASLRVTGTLFGHRMGPVSLSVQDNPRTLPILVVELGAMRTAELQKELSDGMVRIALECERPRERTTGLLDEPVWAVFCNGRKNGYGFRREATEEDLHVMEVLKAVSMGAGVLPPRAEGGGGEMAYVRGVFERVVGSKDSETLYMLSPDGDKGPDLSIFFVRV